MDSVPKVTLLYFAISVLLSGCILTNENQDAWDLAVVEDMETFYRETPAEGRGASGESGLQPGDESLVPATGGRDVIPKPMLSCSGVGGRPGETSFLCVYDLKGLSEEAELPVEADLAIGFNDPSLGSSNSRVPIAYVKETEAQAQFVFLLANAQLEGVVSLQVFVKDERGVHKANVSLVQTSLRATIGLTADQLNGSR